MLGQSKFMLIGVAVAALALVVLVKKKGAAADVGSAIGGAVVDFAGGLATGVLDGVSGAIGIPTTSETITDVGQCRAFMDEYGEWAGTYGCSASAFNAAIRPAPEIIKEVVKDTATSWWSWFSTPSGSDYDAVKHTGAFDRQ